MGRPFLPCAWEPSEIEILATERLELVSAIERLNTDSESNFVGDFESRDSGLMLGGGDATSVLWRALFATVRPFATLWDFLAFRCLHVFNFERYWDSLQRIQCLAYHVQQRFRTQGGSLECRRVS